MIILIVILVVNSIIASSIGKEPEHYANDDEVPLKTINMCGRNIVFPYFSRNNFTASQRSLTDNTIVKTYPSGKCRVDSTNGLVQESHSIVNENSLFYNLKNSCLALRILKYDISTDKLTLNITFSTETENDIQNIISLFLLNPLYIEFVINTDGNSTAYSFNQEHLIFSSTHNKKEGYTLKFVSLSDPAKAACDKTFNYRDYSSKQRMIKKEDLDIILNYESKLMNMKVYYLDTMDSSFQNIGRFISLKYNVAGLNNIFEVDYQKYYQNSYSTQLYEFMNNLALMYTNYIYPVLTFNFSINIISQSNLNGNKYMIWKVYMNNGVGQYQFCTDKKVGMITDTLGGNNNNIMSLVVGSTLDPLFYEAHFFTGQANTCFYGGTNTVSIKLPYLPANNHIKLAVTVTPNEKVILATWQDKHGKKMEFAKRTECTSAKPYDVCLDSTQTTTVNNSLVDLFTKKTDSRIPLANILMQYDPVMVTETDSAVIGYTNLLQKYVQ